MLDWLLSLPPQTYLLILIFVAVLFLAVFVLLVVLVHKGRLSGDRVADVARAVEKFIPDMLAEAAKTPTALDDLAIGWLVVPALKYLESLGHEPTPALAAQVLKYAAHRTATIASTRALLATLPAPVPVPPGEAMKP